MSKVCKECGVVVSNLRKHLRRKRCKKQHVHKQKNKMDKSPIIPLPQPDYPPPDPEDWEEDDEEFIIPTYKGEKKDEDS